MKVTNPEKSGQEAPGPSMDEEWTKPRSELIWFGGLIFVVLAVVGLVLVVDSGPLPSAGPQTVSAAVEVTEVRPVRASRESCTDIGVSDLRSPVEGLWFQTNCSLSVSTQSNQVSTNCNRASLDDSFTPIAPGLFVSRRNLGSQGFLWYSQSDSCFDLVSARIVTAVCVDQTVSFDWSARSVCSGHGGVLAWVNGR